MRRLRLFAAAAVVALGCSGGGDDGPSAPGNTNPTVSVQNNSFAPGTVSVPVSGTVTWVWNSGGVAHNVTFQDGATSGDLTSGSFPRKFDTAGSFSYVCTIHAAEGMAGVVTVGGGAGGGGDDGGGYP